MKKLLSMVFEESDSQQTPLLRGMTPEMAADMPLTPKPSGTAPVSEAPSGPDPSTTPEPLGSGE
jgi:hypothetical protein